MRRRRETDLLVIMDVVEADSEELSRVRNAGEQPHIAEFCAFGAGLADGGQLREVEDQGLDQR